MSAGHYTEDDLILFYYGEVHRPTVIQQHLEQCAGCAASYAEIAGTLSLITPPEEPERGELYGLEVWQRIRPNLPERDLASPWRSLWLRASIGAAIAATLVMAFAVGRFWPYSTNTVSVSIAPEGSSVDVGRRVRVVAIADHLERSERLLMEFANASPTGVSLDVSTRQAWAADLIDSNRFYRHAATGAGDLLVADVLDDLERSLLDIVHGPAILTAADVEAVRERLDTTAVIFKVRVLADELHERNETPSQTKEAI